MWFSDFEIVLRDRIVSNGAVLIENGIIAEIRERPVPDPDVSGDGSLLLPGFIDIHTDAIEKEVEPRKGAYLPFDLAVHEIDRKFASCGITTAYSALSFIRMNAYGYKLDERRTAQIVRTIHEMRGRLMIDHRLHIRFEKTFDKALAIVQEIVGQGYVDLLSLMDHTPGQGQFRDVQQYLTNMMETEKLTRPQAEDAFRRKLQDVAGTTVSESIQAALAADAVSRGAVIASHDDDTVEKVRLAAALGARISEFPITLEAATVARNIGLATAMGAPNALRGGSYSGNLSAREAYSAGQLDILTSDYHAASLLPAAMALAATAPGGLSAAIALISANPAAALSLQDRGAIETGLRADLVLVKPGAAPSIRATYCAGRLVYSDGSLAAPSIDR